jgi:hypothetical protein
VVVVELVVVVKMVGMDGGRGLSILRGPGGRWRRRGLRLHGLI